MGLLFLKVVAFDSDSKRVLIDTCKQLVENGAMLSCSLDVPGAYGFS